jgi:hypothetical protein
VKQPQLFRTSPWVFSPQWTDADKVKLCVLFTHIFRDDFTAGRYGQVGRPNVQSLHELLQCNTEELERYRPEIETIALAYEEQRDVGEALAKLKASS